MDELKIDKKGKFILQSITYQYTKIMRRKILKNNTSSCKILVPKKYLADEVLVLFLEKKS